ncbi:MAG: hypothetical protein JNL73_02975, partial [Anaerolineales bacterium]|nr:hypothetical protein [Anaerolineales bacterium]
MHRLQWMTAVLLAALILSPFGHAQAGVILTASNTRVTDSGQLDAWVGEPD